MSIYFSDRCFSLEFKNSLWGGLSEIDPNTNKELSNPLIHHNVFQPDSKVGSSQPPITTSLLEKLEFRINSSD